MVAGKEKKRKEERQVAWKMHRDTAPGAVRMDQTELPLRRQPHRHVTHNDSSLNEG